MSRIHRRRFLQRAAMAGVAVSAPLLYSGRLGAEPYEGPCFAIFNARGGLDQTYLTDPRGGDLLNRLYAPGEIREHGAIRYAPTAGRIEMSRRPQMSNEDFFARYGDDLIVFNGIDCSINNHAPCQRYIATGKLNSLDYPTFAALVAAARAPDAALGFLTFGNYSGTGNLIAATRLPYQSSLRSLGGVRMQESAPHVEAQRLVDEALGQVAELGEGLPATRRARDFLYAAQVNSSTLGEAADVLEMGDPGQDAFDIAIAAFRSGLGVSANFDRGTFDSHDSNDRNQMARLPELLADVDYFVRRATDAGLADRLVVVIQSEMGRTPWYNGDDGKDHWSINSKILMRPGVRENRVIGATQVDPETGNDLFPMRVDPETLALSESGILVRPEHIHDALRRYAGINDHPHSMRFDLDVPEDERLQGLFSPRS